MKLFNNKKIILIFYLTLFKIPIIYSIFHYREFTSKPYRAGHLAFNSQGDMIIEYSYERDRLFFGLKQNGRYFFENNGTEKATKELEIQELNDNYQRYEAQNLFISIKDINNIQYLLSISAYYVIELFDINNINKNDYKINKNTEYFFSDFDSLVFSVLSKNNSNEYFVIYLSNYDHNCYIKKIEFSNF